MTPIEVIALIVALGAIIKLLVIAANKNKWTGVVDYFYVKKAKLMLVIYIVLAIVVFYYLIQAMTIIQIFAAMAFLGLLVGITFLAYPKDISSFAKRILKGKLPPLIWIVSLVWLVLSVWVLLELFA